MFLLNIHHICYLSRCTRGNCCHYADNHLHHSAMHGPCTSPAIHSGVARIPNAPAYHLTLKSLFYKSLNTRICSREQPPPCTKWTTMLFHICTTSTSSTKLALATLAPLCAVLCCVYWRVIPTALGVTSIASALLISVGDSLPSCVEKSPPLFSGGGGVHVATDLMTSHQTSRASQMGAMMQMAEAITPQTMARIIQKVK